MTATIPTVEPTEVTAGDTWQWRRKVTDYPAADYNLTYYLEGPGNLEITAVAEADGIGWLVTAAKADTAQLPAGPYVLHGFVSDDDERYRAYRGGLAVKRDPASIETPRKSHAQEMYDLITAKLEGRLPADRERATIDGTSIDRIPVGELMRLRGIYANLVQRELRPDRSPVGSVVCRDVV